MVLRREGVRVVGGEGSVLLFQDLSAVHRICGFNRLEWVNFFNTYVMYFCLKFTFILL
jgi:hypothetical protein